MKKISLLLLLSFFGKIVLACTTFCINKNGQIVFGRNYDWVTGAGIVYTNQRGLFKTSVNTGEGGIASWVSKYGSITFNQYGKEFPTGGMNEKGLVVELMWLDGTEYPSPDTRPALRVLQWIQYQLDNAATTAELIASDVQIRINTKASPIHFLVADAAGKVATIEFLNGKMVVHKDETLPYPVLTNDVYASAAITAGTLLKKGGPVSTGNNSLDRFVEACSMIKKIDAPGNNLPLTDYAFSILDKVSQGDFTKWSIVYDISNKKILFKTSANIEIKTIEFAAFNLACKQPAKMFNMNQDGKGDISTKFILPDMKLKQELLQQAVMESISRFTITKKEEEELLHFEEGIKCKE